SASPAMVSVTFCWFFSDSGVSGRSKPFSYTASTCSIMVPSALWFRAIVTDPHRPWLRRGQRLHLLQAGFRHRERVLLPVLAIEQLQRHVAAVTHRPQRGEDLFHWRNPVAGVDAVGVRDLGPVDLRVVVHVEDADR